MFIVHLPFCPPQPRLSQAADTAYMCSLPTFHKSCRFKVYRDTVHLIWWLELYNGSGLNIGWTLSRRFHTKTLPNFELIYRDMLQALCTWKKITIIHMTLQITWHIKAKNTAKILKNSSFLSWYIWWQFVVNTRIVNKYDVMYTVLFTEQCLCAAEIIALLPNMVMYFSLKWCINVQVCSSCSLQATLLSNARHIKSLFGAFSVRSQDITWHCWWLKCRQDKEGTRCRVASRWLLLTQKICVASYPNWVVQLQTNLHNKWFMSKFSIFWSVSSGTKCPLMCKWPLERLSFKC